MPTRNRLPLPWRLAVAAALAAWLAAALWLLVLLAGAEPAREHSPFTALGELLVPAMLLAAVALLLVVVPRRLVGAWGFVFVFALAGVPAWLFLRGAAYDAVPAVTSATVTAVVWMVLGLVVALLALPLLELRGVAEPRQTLEYRPGFGVGMAQVTTTEEDGEEVEPLQLWGLPGDKGPGLDS